MVIGFTVGYQALSLRGDRSFCVLWLHLLHFIVTMFVFSPFLTNGPAQPGQDVSVDLEEDLCGGSLIMQRKAGVSLCWHKRRRHLLLFAMAHNRRLEVRLCSAG